MPSRRHLHARIVTTATDIPAHSRAAHPEPRARRGHGEAPVEELLQGNGFLFPRQADRAVTGRRAFDGYGINDRASCGLPCARSCALLPASLLTPSRVGVDALLPSRSCLELAATERVDAAGGAAVLAVVAAERLAACLVEWLAALVVSTSRGGCAAGLVLTFAAVRLVLSGRKNIGGTTSGNVCVLC
jgi:hypothetical protein